MAVQFIQVNVVIYTVDVRLLDSGQHRCLFSLCKAT